MNILFANNYIQKNNSINFNYKDTCKITKLKFLEKETLKILTEYYNLYKKSGYSFCTKKHIISIDYKKVDDSTNIYVVLDDIYLGGLLINLPSYYYLTDSSIICIYTGKENPKKLNHTCIKQFYEDAKKYSIDSYKVLSWKNLEFKENVYTILECTSVCMWFKVIKEKIFYTYFYYDRLYKKNMKNKVKIYYYDGTPILY
ncbi:hypothetical protein KAZ01_02770 [Candidatus Gracilibacteria bacterium]|nr:hypothetical protein [Candidatus Gracilibacteria bacterium]